MSKKADSKKDTLSTSKKGKELSLPDSSNSDISDSQTRSDILAILERDQAKGFSFCIINHEGKVVPFMGGSSYSDLLLMKYMIEKEVDRIIFSEKK